MKRAQTIAEYVILSAVTLLIAAVVLWSFNISNLASISIFGVKTNKNTVTIPAMTP
jgi:uncharacterized Fe-S cluster-containing radical SAM superfamily enzyme